MGADGSEIRHLAEDRVGPVITWPEGRGAHSFGARTSTGNVPGRTAIRRLEKPGGFAHWWASGRRRSETSFDRDPSCRSGDGSRSQRLQTVGQDSDEQPMFIGEPLA